MTEESVPPQEQGEEMSWSFTREIRGDGLDCGKIVQGEEDVRTFIEKHADALPPAEMMIDRLQKFDPLA
ncbi:hypothetical protein J2129_001645 [Methanofollis sp. W23]|nr:hypothetical protein [Methanofollis sp. W23]